MGSYKSALLTVTILGTLSLLNSPQISKTAHGQSAGSDSTASDQQLADAFSRRFRDVAKKSLPAVVSIQSVGKVSGSAGSPFADPMDDEFFRNNPFFRDFFERMPQGSPRVQPQPEPRRAVGQGSGFIIDPSGVILTNAHVVRGADEVRVQLSDGREFKATDIKSDDRADVAVIRISVQEKLPFLTMGNEDELEIGDWVLAFGSPFGLHRTVTQGIISAKSRGLQDSRMRQEFLQTDAAINPGNSGGPLVNLKGQVIGVNTAISTSSGGYDGVGFAVPASLAKWAADQLQNNGKVRRAYIGVYAQDIDSGLAESLGLDIPHGVLVAEITKGAPAEKAGLQIQDVITELNGQQITNSRKLMAVAEKLTVGQMYPLTILRSGKKMTIEVTVAELPEKLIEEPSQPESAEQSDSQGTSIDELGISVRPVTPEIAKELNLDVAKGVAITSVKSDSYASQLRIQAGDIILRMGTKDVNTTADVKKAVEDARKSQRILLYLKTAEGTRFISVPLVVKP
jgi:serine protease Do